MLSPKLAVITISPVPLYVTEETLIWSTEATVFVSEARTKFAVMPVPQLSKPEPLTVISNCFALKGAVEGVIEVIDGAGFVEIAILSKYTLPSSADQTTHKGSGEVVSYWQMGTIFS